MTKYSFLRSMSALAIAAAVLSIAPAQRTVSSSTSVSSASQTSDAAYRDGIYIGKIHAERGTQPHVASGRWNDEKDRQNFAAGYWKAYQQTFASLHGSALGQR